MRRDFSAPQGAVHRIAIDSKVLIGNPLGDPTNRIVDVYVPAGQSGKGLPLLVDLVGFTAGGPAHTNWRNFTESIPEQLDRLIYSVERRQLDLELELAEARGIPILYLGLTGETPVPIWDFKHTDDLITQGYEIARRVVESQRLTNPILASRE